MKITKETLKNAALILAVALGGGTAVYQATETPTPTPSVEITDEELNNDIHLYAVDVVWEITAPVSIKDNPGIPDAKGEAVFKIKQQEHLKKTSIEVVTIDLIKDRISPLDSTYNVVSWSNLRLVK